MPDENYDRAELERLWKLGYDELAQAPGQPGARLREARYILQARVAWETRRYMLVTSTATVVMAIATVVMAIGTLL